MRRVDHYAVDLNRSRAAGFERAHNTLCPVALGLSIGECLVYDGDLRWMDRRLGAEAIAARRVRFARQRIGVTKIDEYRIDRLYAERLARPTGKDCAPVRMAQYRIRSNPG